MKPAQVAKKVKSELSVKRAALTLGFFAALLHLVWSLLVALGLAQGLVNWRLGMHFVNLQLTVLPFSLVSAIILVVLAFIGGAVIGTVFALIWNKVRD